MGAHPFAWLSDRAQQRALTVLLLLLLILTTFLMVLGEPLRTPAAPQGIVSYELAGSGAAAGAILESWQPSVQRMAMLHLGLDYLYLIVYPAFLALACVRVAGRLRERASGLARLGTVVSWGALAAGAFDAVENVALIRMLTSGPSDAMARLAWACAVPKFALVVLGIAYAALGFVGSLVGRRARP